MRKLFKLLSSINFLYQLSIRLIANRIVYSDELLTPEHLFSKGWILVNGFFIEPNVKERDKLWIQFENHYFRVYHGEDKTFIALESKKAWFENYYLLIHTDNGRWQLAGI